MLQMHGFHRATSSRVQPPAVNLKERIAALQQRNTAQNPRSTSPPAVPVSSQNSKHEAPKGLRDRIAKFEQKGGVPIPRGSFGLGAPPVPENGQQKRRGELYGNRIPAPVRSGILTPQVTGGTVASWGRSVSSPGILTPQVTGGTLSSWRSMSSSPDSRAVSPTDWDDMPEDEDATTTLKPPTFSDLGRSPSQPFPIDHESVDGNSEFEPPSPAKVDMPIEFDISSEGQDGISVSSTSASDSSISPAQLLGIGETQAGETSTPSTPDVHVQVLDSSAMASSVDLNADQLLSNIPEPKEDVDLLCNEPNEELTANTSQPSSLGLIDTLSTDVIHTGERVDQELDLDEHSLPESAGSVETLPFDTQEPSRPLEVDGGSDFAPEEGSIQSLPISGSQPATSPSIAISPPTAPAVEHVLPPLAIEVLSPERPLARLAYEDSPSPSGTPTPTNNSSTPTIQLSSIVAPSSPRPRSIANPPSERPSPTSDVFSPPSHKSSYSVSHDDLDATHMRSIPMSFSAVVHRKKTETASSTTTFKPRMPATPVKKRDSYITEPLTPGGGELTRLVEEAALLERLLSGGEIPSEIQDEGTASTTPPSEVEAAPIPSILESPPVQPESGHQASIEDTDRVRSGPLSSFKSALSRSKSSQGRTSSEQAVSPKQTWRQSTIPLPRDSLSVSAQDDNGEVPPAPPPKSPNKVFSGMRNSIHYPNALKKRPSHMMPGAYPRDSVSVSSDDSFALVTPPDTLGFLGPDDKGSTDTFINMNSSSNLSVSEFGSGGHVTRAGTVGPGSSPSVSKAWPSSSPKKSKSFSRAASFAGKMFQRARTKSSESTISASDMARRMAIDALEEPLPSILVRDEHTLPPSAGLHPPSPTHPTSPNRPESYISVASSTSSAPTLDLFDAFPSVPQNQSFHPAGPRTFSHIPFPQDRGTDSWPQQS
ncbi:hypothetical protein BDN71DRAFT_1512995 [Pleurotus eryngii]|uniref:Uncharacterized protein n=1 Tax=Pleurotus eryngii TaxID=5323 RepID=A0A9P5ZI41_PLEER|nr:hypothetical protein BDN71DRAFT_1512995 [Pleurotus eryngii]